MQSLVEFIKSIKESKEGDKIPVEVYTYLQELLNTVKNKSMKAEIDLLLNDHFDDGETSTVNINGNITDKISISNKELYEWCKGLVNDDCAVFLIINSQKDFLFCIEGGENRCYIHDKNSDDVEEKFFDGVEANIKIYHNSYDNDPTKEWDSYVKYSRDDIKQYEDDISIDAWVEALADDLSVGNNLGEFADNVLSTVLNKKSYNEYKNILSDKDTFIYMSY